ncbi:MAG: hypothetical protein A2X61_00080 [Ignavibacteria bacterium GWB2_35_12]|nr:MAG: hypothetical protein A2X63_01400 [Ignavibacteria bacterium GWA2_35_8]OGU38981.1 MAG: hypothetical protein A2X61_00080 [Ignavibacteria bacterium GWB2_35_12]OGU96198.1 MAG: hypothetical protein A2220_13500 [Ignavibacteria bacterium RIFOXYA2_FULL_35_10]OGV20708.1 MAG: hypothetical protein A2475_05905 [Ignavibacteria bacterium RIFOXYC2_FULL_35_21]
MNTFADVLETIDNFPIEEQEELSIILQKRLTEYKREQLIKTVREAQEEYKRGESKPASVDEIMKEILS